MTHEPTHLDLFSGIGGFALAAQWAGFRTVAFCEIDRYCRAILKARFGAVADAVLARRQQDSTGSHGHETAHEGRASELHYQSSSCREGGRPRLHSDIFTLDGSRYRGVSLITGGFPCQPFSCAGKRRGAADDRAIWPQMCRVIDEARPGWVLAENVPGIISMELDRVLSDLETLGYSVGTLVVPACAVEAKHRRDRVWIVANASERRCTGTGARESEQPWRAQAECAGQTMANAISEGLEIKQCQPGDNGPQQSALERSGDARCRWLPEPDVGRVASGIPARVDRLRSLGNSIVPQVAYQILKEIRRMIP